MAGSTSYLDDDEPISGINVTPLVDVVLVLLIIFLITAPAIYQSAIKVQLPKARTGEEATQASPLQFSLLQDGTLLFNGATITWPQLAEKLKAIPSIDTQTAVVSADQATPHGTVVRLMDELRAAGLLQFALSVDSRPAGK